MRSHSAPQTIDPIPMNRKSMVATEEMPLCDHPVCCAIGTRKTASDIMAPMPMHVITMPAPTTTQP